MHLTRVTVAPSFAPLSCGALWKSWASVSGEFNKLRARESKRGAVDFCVLIWFLRGNPLKTDHLSLKRFIFSIGGANFPWKGCYSVASRNNLYVRLICFVYLFSLNTVQKFQTISDKGGSFTSDSFNTSLSRLLYQVNINFIQTVTFIFTEKFRYWNSCFFISSSSSYLIPQWNNQSRN